MGIIETTSNRYPDDTILPLYATQYASFPTPERATYQDAFDGVAAAGDIAGRQWPVAPGAAVWISQSETAGQVSKGRVNPGSTVVGASEQARWPFLRPLSTGGAQSLNVLDTTYGVGEIVAEIENTGNGSFAMILRHGAAGRIAVRLTGATGAMAVQTFGALNAQGRFQASLENVAIKALATAAGKAHVLRATAAAVVDGKSVVSVWGDHALLGQVAVANHFAGAGGDYAGQMRHGVWWSDSDIKCFSVTTGAGA